MSDRLGSDDVAVRGGRRSRPPRRPHLLRDEQGRRPVFGDAEKLQNDPHFRDHLLFFEYFHGDTGRGCGASHQTGWTGLIAKLISDLHEPVEP
jgi:hypothetical protein